jgi:hypothetical protein
VFFDHEAVPVFGVVGHQARLQVQAGSPHGHVEGASAGVGLGCGRPMGITDDVDEGFADDGQDAVPDGVAGWGLAGTGGVHQRPG